MARLSSRIQRKRTAKIRCGAQTIYPVFTSGALTPRITQGSHHVRCGRKLLPKATKRLQTQRPDSQREIRSASDTLAPCDCTHGVRYLQFLVLTFLHVQLDEAHNIKERSTNTAKAAFELNSKYKWCLSGTPLQNRVGELYSLVRFLGGDPFSYYFCKSISFHALPAMAHMEDVR